MTRKRRKVNLTDISDPRGITLTKSPANLSGFKIVRSNSLEKRSDLRAIVLPEAADKTFIGKVIEAYNLGETYSLREDAGAQYLAINGFSTDEVVVPAPLGFGLTGLIAMESVEQAQPHAPVSRSDKQGKNEIDFKHPELVSLSLAKTHFEDAKAAALWIEENAIDTDEAIASQTKEAFVFRFSKQDNAAPVDLGEGISVEIAPKQGGKLPSSIYRNVLHKTYGYEGMWDFIDFAHASANPGYIESSETAIRTLCDVLHNILLYSDLSVEEKKVAASSAVSSFESYTLNLLNSLPEPQIKLERHLPTRSTETKSMTEKAPAPTAEEQEVTRSETQEAETTEETATADPSDTITVSRSELQDLVRECLISVKMDKEDDTASAADSEEATKEAQRSDPMDIISSAMEKLAQTTETLAQRMQAVEENITKEQEDSVTVARSKEDETEQQQQETASVFKGVFG